MRNGISVYLRDNEIHVLIDSLEAHFAGDTSEGDLCWSEQEHKSAVDARLKLGNAVAKLEKFAEWKQP